MDADHRSRLEAARARRTPRPGQSKCGTLREQLLAIGRYLQTARGAQDEQAWQQAIRQTRRAA